MPHPQVYTVLSPQRTPERERLEMVIAPLDPQGVYVDPDYQERIPELMPCDVVYADVIDASNPSTKGGTQTDDLPGIPARAGDRNR
jgi:hypothetical protein